VKAASDTVELDASPVPSPEVTFDHVTSLVSSAVQLPARVPDETNVVCALMVAVCVLRVRLRILLGLPVDEGVTKIMQLCLEVLKEDLQLAVQQVQQWATVWSHPCSGGVRGTWSTPKPAQWRLCPAQLGMATAMLETCESAAVAIPEVEALWEAVRQMKMAAPNSGDAGNAQPCGKEGVRSGMDG
ncbi:unnamed protein product, partial [Discosporangium mesarthrocarpum]